LMVVCLVDWFLVISNPREQMSKRIFCMMTFLFLIVHISFKMDIASLSTDHPMAVLTLIFCLVLLDKLDHKILLLLPLSAVAFAFKISGMLIIGTGLIAMVGYLFLLKHEKNRLVRKMELKIHLTSFVLCCFIGSGFIIRNVIVSGWLIYPFPIGNLHLPWSIPKPYVLDMIAWIKNFPKIPGGASPTTIADHGFFFWFTQWFEGFKQKTESMLFAWSLLALFWSVFQIRSFAKFIYARLNILLLVLFSLASIVFWFISAPDIRFGSIYFFIFFASSIVLVYEGSKYKNVLKNLIYVLFIFQIAREIPGYYIDRTPGLFTFAYTKVPKLVRVIGSPPDQKPALYIYMPLKGNQCGNSPIPCTPYAGGLLHSHHLIRQRVPGDLSKGFLAIE
ncbi:MAG TPA: hypothetical protein VK616_13545, partial [Flavitalea sp.]|nr:hypothetical protein [Flavitalea sp.]